MRGGDWPAEGLERIGACPACGAASSELLYEDLEDRVFFSAPGRWALQRCLLCRAAFLDPRPTPETIGRAYSDYYTHDEPSSPNLVDRLLPGGTPAVERAPADLALQPGARCLDVGCGSGALLRRLRAAGFEAQGIDPDPIAVATARRAGFEVVEGGLTRETFEPGSFDAVTMNHALEHVHDPAETLGICRALLRPGGRLWIATPNLDSWGHRRFESSWLHLDPPRHLVLFTRASLDGLASSAGFGARRFRASRTATLAYPASLAIQRGEPPMEFVPPRSHVLWARLVDVAVSLRPQRAEELVLLAS